MKKAVIILTIIFLSISAKADLGNDYHIKFLIETENGEISKGYAWVDRYSFDMDSLKNKVYLKAATEQYRPWCWNLDSSQYSDSWWEKVKDDTLRYFQDRIIYEYQSVWRNPGRGITQDSISYLVNKVNIPLKEIKTIKIDKVTEVSPITQIASEKLEVGDSIWLKQKPVRKVQFVSHWGFVCSHQIFIHANSEKVDSVIRQLELKQKELEEMEYEDIDNDPVKINKEIFGIIKKLDGDKVVIISTCTD